MPDRSDVDVDVDGHHSKRASAPEAATQRQAKTRSFCFLAASAFILYLQTAIRIRTLSRRYQHVQLAYSVVLQLLLSTHASRSLHHGLVLGRSGARRYGCRSVASPTSTTSAPGAVRCVSSCMLTPISRLR